MSSWRWWPAPAKINLFLHIVGRRSDGYHNLQTAFQFVDLCDQIGLRLRSDGVIQYITPIMLMHSQDDLVSRAAHKLQQLSGNAQQGVDIQLNKNIPIGGGLGGGSSDAATTLVALNQMWELGLSVDVLAEIGLSLGADVPVFIRGHAAWAEGVGDQLVPIEPETPWYLILAPNAQVSTAEIFSHPELTRNSDLIRIRSSFSSLVRNDCLGVVLGTYPEVKRVYDWLKIYKEPRMTGTGACLFAGFDSQEEAHALLAKLPEGVAGWVAKGLNHSPLQQIY